MSELTVEVVHVVAPDELDEYDLDPALRERADGRYLLVGRKGGSPSLGERVWAFLRRSPIEAVTLVADEGAEEGEELTVEAAETDTPGVYEVR
ncbi:DUF7526 family protein [Halosegnis marinus]|uniref:Uncharacterized protein n=1 Tax=Halosegnis marinus TaxID=3034023 RepID=A0ABD5ZP08_9EURY|nr:hypothetical protein [Halosegnis sp. DT85]